MVLRIGVFPNIHLKDCVNVTFPEPVATDTVRNVTIFKVQCVLPPLQGRDVEIYIDRSGVPTNEVCTISFAPPLVTAAEVRQTTQGYAQAAWRPVWESAATSRLVARARELGMTVPQLRVADGVVTIPTTGGSIALVG